MANKILQKLQFKPGINREGTNYAAEGGWWDCNRIRFRNGLPEQIGGWTKASATQTVGVARKLLNWQTLDGSDMMGVATSKKVYIESGGGFSDITPVRSSVTAANPLATTFANSVLLQGTTAAPHGAQVGDYVTVSGASVDFDGVLASSVNREFQILSVPTPTTFTIAGTMLSSVGSTSGGGPAVTFAFQLGIGADYAVSGTGWGAGTWGRGTWGSAAAVPAGSVNQIRLWSLANYGEDLVFALRGGSIYYWDATGGLAARGVLLSTLGGAADVPAQVNTLLITQERHAIALGATEVGGSNFDPLLIRWSNQEEIMNWTPTTTNTAGDYRLTFGSYIVTGTATRDEILIFTDASLHSMRYTGPPYVFSLTQISDNISIVGPNAAITANNVTYWMGRDKFYFYNGTAQTLPCSVRRYVFDNIGRSQAAQIHAGVNERHSEIWWFYCSEGSVNIDRYVVFNYAEGIWYYGQMSRAAWLDAPVRGQPYAVGDGYLYAHEDGADDGSVNPPVSLNAYAESSYFDIEDGTAFYFVERVLPDVTFVGSTATAPSAVMTLKVRDFPGQDTQASASRTTTRSVEAPVEQFTKEVWVRLRGRHVSFKIASPSDAGTVWQLGAPRLGVRTDGRR